MCLGCAEEDSWYLPALAEAQARSLSSMSAAAQAKVKLFKEIEELKRKVAEADEAVSELAEAREELKRRDGERAQLEQWKKDFMEGSKHMNKMKRETGEAKDLAMALKRKLKAAEEKDAFNEMRIAKLTDQVKLAEAIRDGTNKKSRQQDKDVKKMKQFTQVHESLRVGAEEELRKTKQFLDQERTYRLQDLHRHNEIMVENEELERAKLKLRDDHVEAVKDVVKQRVRVRKLKGELEANKLITMVADQDISQQNSEIGSLKLDILELKRVVQEKNKELSVWAQRFMELETEYNRVQQQLASVATSASERSHTVASGRYARHGASASVRPSPAPRALSRTAHHYPRLRTAPRCCPLHRRLSP